MAAFEDIHRQTDFSDNRAWVNPCEDYDTQRLDEIVEEQCKALGLDSIVKEGCTVVIKPNLVIRRAPDEATNTHP